MEPGAAAEQPSQALAVPQAVPQGRSFFPLLSAGEEGEEGREKGGEGAIAVSLTVL